MFTYFLIGYFAIGFIVTFVCLSDAKSPLDVILSLSVTPGWPGWLMALIIVAIQDYQRKKRRLRKECNEALLEALYHLKMIQADTYFDSLRRLP